ncbi:MAG: FkbM family methyltransferase [Nitrososphaeria archaeon]
MTSRYGHRKVNISKVNDYYNITIYGNTETYKFMLNLFPSPRIPISNDLTSLVDIFSRKFYDYYPIKGKIVDIGGYIGDTAVYFIKKGAEFVEVYEPNPYNFELMVSNIALNNATANIKPINSAISKNSGESVLHVSKFIAGLGSLYEIPANSITLNVNTISCQEALNKHIDLLKMNCKGCEVDIILNCGEKLKENIDHLIFQYTDISENSLSIMLEKLRDLGFTIDKVDRQYRMVYAQKLSTKKNHSVVFDNFIYRSNSQ